MSMIHNLITGLNQNAALSEIKTAAFQPGQIVNGKILKLFPNGIASLQVGSQTIVAQLEASLESNQRYWFQVKPGEGKVKLKVLASAANHTRSDDSITTMLKELHISVNNENMKITRYLLKEQLPVSKEIVEQASQWVSEQHSDHAGLEVIKQMLKRQLPFSKSAFQAIAAVHTPYSLTDSLEDLDNLLQGIPLSKAGQQLQSFIKGLFPFTSVEQHEMHDSEVNGNKGDSLLEPSSFVNNLQALVTRLGYSYEHEVGRFLKEQSDSNFENDHLKSLLMNVMKDEPTDIVREKAETILHKITGLQLLAQNAAPIEQFVFQIPFPLLHKTVNLTMQWSGRKNENGQIDPSYCRILFYLELEHLQDTVVDMQVQNRIMTLSIVNEHDNLKPLAAPYLNILTENLKELSFTLSSVHFIKPSEHKIKQEAQGLSASLTNSHYSGVDIRI